MMVGDHATPFKNCYFLQTKLYLCEASLKLLQKRMAVFQQGYIFIYMVISLFTLPEKRM